MPGTTPIYAFPFPLSTDQLSQGAAQIEALARAIENNGFLKAPVPVARVYRSVQQGLANGVWTTVGCDTVEFQTGGLPYNSPGVFQAPRAGYYRAYGHVVWAGDGNGTRNLWWIRGSGSAVVITSRPHAGASPVHQSVETTVYLAVNEQLHFQALHDSTSMSTVSTLVTPNGAMNVFMTIQYISP